MIRKEAENEEVAIHRASCPNGLVLPQG